MREEKEPTKRVRSGVEQRMYDEGGKRAKKMVCSMRAHIQVLKSWVSYYIGNCYSTL
jgi:hypothetical protein